MVSAAEQHQIHYEFAMAIGESLDLKVMLRKSLSTLLRKTNCRVGGVHFLKRGDDGKCRFEQVFSIPRDTSRIDEYQSILEAIPAEMNKQQLVQFKNTLPFQGQVTSGRFYHILELPDIGIIILMRSGQGLATQFVRSLMPLFLKLATACRACLQNEELLGHQRDLEELVAEKSRELVTRNMQLIQKINERRKLEERFRLAAKAMSDLIYEWRVEDNDLRWFGDIDAALGFKPGEFTHDGDSWIARIHPEDRSWLSQTVEKHRISSEPIHYEYRIKHKDGSWRYWINNGLPVLNEDGRPVKWIGACVDITDRRKTEQALRESEERYRSLFTNAIDAISIFDPDSKRIVDVNDAFLSFYGYTREEALQLSTDDISGEPEKTQKAIRQALETGPVYIHGRRHLKKNGAEIYVDLSAGAFTWKGRGLMFSIIRDVTERYENEQERERLIGELQEALENIKTLSGLLPICARCKKIRDDRGYWNQIETYIINNTDADFSHGLCPDCLEKMYGEQDWYKKRRK